MKAATPPRFWASAMTCWQTVVLPDDSGPKISVIRPRGMPPTPSARSRAIEPVGMKSTCWRAGRAQLHDRAGAELLLDREDGGVDGLAALRLGALGDAVAVLLGRFLAVPLVRGSLPGHRHRVVTLLSIQLSADRPCHGPRGRVQPSSVSSSTGFGLRGFRISSACCGGGSESDVQLRLAELVLRLLLRFAVGTISRAHRCSSAVERRLPIGPSRGLLRDFICRLSGPRALEVPT